MGNIIQCVSDTYKLRVLTLLAADVLKCALYDSTANLGPDTAAYTTTGEVVGTGYTAGGVTLTGATASISQNTAYIDFGDASWPASTLTARAAMIYNASDSNRAILILNFGQDRVSNSSEFLVRFPSADPTSALLRIA